MRLPGFRLLNVLLTSFCGLAAAAVAPPAAHAALTEPWWSETVDAAGDVGYFTSLAVDGRDGLHIAYADFARAALKYARHTAAGWDTATVTRVPGQTGWHAALALALDRDGAPRIAYQDEARGDLRFAWRAASGWRTEAVDTAGVVGSHLSLALDRAGHAHIAYYDEDRRALRHAWQDAAGVWQREVADSLQPFDVRDVGLYTSIAVDAAGEPHVAYYDAAQGDLRYAAKAAGVWTVQVLDFLGDVGRYCALALDSRGRAAIGYTDFANVSTSPGLSATALHGKHVKYARELADGSWLVDIADAIGVGAQYVSLALDADDHEHLVYYDFFQLLMKYSVEHDDGWDLTQPGLPQLAGDFPSIGFDRAQTPCVSYLDLTGERGALAIIRQGLALRSPAAGTHWAADDSATVSWQGTGAVTIEVSLDDGANWETLAREVTGGTARVHTPANATTTARLRVMRAAPFAQAQTDTTFAIGAPPPVLRVSGGSAGTPVRIAFTPPAGVEASARVQWRVCDVAGRCMARGEIGTLRAGATRTVEWAGATSATQRAARGAYVVQVTWPGGHAAARALWLNAPAATR